jgi:hypothetical protein
MIAHGLRDSQRLGGPVHETDVEIGVGTLSAARVRSTKNYGRQIRGRAEPVDDFIEQPALGGRYQCERYGGSRHYRSLDYHVRSNQHARIGILLTTKTRG